MAEDRRRLVAILAADVVGYPRLVGADEAGTLARLRALFHEAVQPTVSANRGRVFKLLGDAFLAGFGSAVDAVRCAAALQDVVSAREAGGPTEARTRLRIGVHLGDAVVQGGDLLGDGVNVAARVEGEAEPGGVAVSGAVAEAVRGRVPFGFLDPGERVLKNIARPVRVFRFAAEGRAPAAAAPALPDKPSIVVLPFQDMGGDAEQAYVVDGLVEDITTALSRIRSFFVIARSSAFTYKGRAVDVRQVGRELGVRYVLEGSVRRGGTRLRISGQLAGATTGARIWADRFDGEMDDVFAFQDRVVESVAGAIEPSLQQAELLRTQQKATQALGAYHLFLRGMALVNSRRLDRLREAQALFLQAATLDPLYGAAWGMAGFCLAPLKAEGLMANSPADIAEARRLARLASEAGRDDPIALLGAATTLAYSCMDPEAGALLIERACALNPSSAMCWGRAAYIRNCLGDATAAMANCERALRLSPRDPGRGHVLHQMAMAHVQAGRYGRPWNGRSVPSATPTNSAQYNRTLAAALALAGRLQEARSAMAEMCRLAPQLRLSRLDEFRGPFRNADFSARQVEAYRLAGMPE